MIRKWLLGKAWKPLLLVTVLGLFFFISWLNHWKLQKNAGCVIGQVTKISEGKKSDPLIHYEFDVSGKQYTGITRFGAVFRGEEKSELTSDVLVIYWKSNPETNAILSLDFREIDSCSQSFIDRRFDYWKRRGID